MRALRFKQVDVFTSVPFLGNPVAVVLGAEGLSGDRMQAIAGWTNLSETTFVLPPSSAAADYALRIFTPRAELPFAGHPTLGSAHAVLEAGVAKPRDGVLRQECGAGIIELTVSESGPARLWLRAPKITLRAFASARLPALEAALGAKVLHDPVPQVVDVGPVWLVANLRDADEVGALVPDMAALAALSEAEAITGMVVFGAATDGIAQLHVRAFAPAHGVPEDPVCGSGNISVGAFLAQSGLTDVYGSEYRARQGMQLGRDGRIAVRVLEGGARIELGGDAVTCVDGTLRV